MGSDNSDTKQQQSFARKICTGQAGFLWNVLCCPFVCTVGLLVRSLLVYCVPCVDVLFFRCWSAIHQYLCFCFGWPYQDDEFIGAKAIGGDNTTAQQIDWVRAHELDAFQGKRPQLFQGKIEPNDLCQGAIGNCWLVAALACASEHPDTIRNVFLTKEYNPRGLYKVRIFDPVLKQFVVIVVDDRIPCVKGTKKPKFMAPNGTELWAMILEKAYAKYCGSYAQLDGGFVLWAWHSMTSDNVFQMSRNANSPTWIREDMVAFDKKGDKRACGFRQTKETYTEDNLWTLLKKYDRQGALISASIGKTDYGKFAGPNGEQLLEGEGLVAGHAYSIIQAFEVSNSVKIGAINTNLGGQNEIFKLVQIRNPWGTFEWKGDWSDKSPLWKKYSNVARAVKFEDADDGSFFMSFDDFKQFYTRVNICDRTTINDMSLDINEDRGFCGIVCGFLSGCASFWLCCRGMRNLYCGHRSTADTLDTNEGCCSCCYVV